MALCLQLRPEGFHIHRRADPDPQLIPATPLGNAAEDLGLLRSWNCLTRRRGPDSKRCVAAYPVVLLDAGSFEVDDQSVAGLLVDEVAPLRIAIPFQSERELRLIARRG